MSSSDLIIVSMPYYECSRTVRRAVDSVLAQTYENLRLVVINDGGGAKAWQPLHGIADKRLIRLDLQQNHGRYYADAVSLASCPTGGLLAIHDADDWSEPTWLAHLHQNLGDHVAVFSDQLVHHGNRTTLEKPSPNLSTRETLPKLEKLSHQAGLYRADALRAIGGQNPMFRFGFDLLLVNLMRMVGSCGYIEEPLYHRMIRFGSLTTSRSTGFGSWQRRAVDHTLEQLYAALLYLQPNEIGPYLWGTVPDKTVRSLKIDSLQLRAKLGELINDHS